MVNKIKFPSSFYFTAFIFFICGLVVAAALYPINLKPLFFLAFILVFYWAKGIKDEEDSAKNKLAQLGWLFGAGQFLGGFYWVGESFLVLGGAYIYMMPFAIGALVASLALFAAVPFYIWGYFKLKNRVADLLLLALFWSLAEYARAHLFSGLPWNISGMAAAHSPAEQLVSLAGIYALGAGVMIIIALFASAQRLPIIFAAFILLASYFGGQYLLDRESTSEQNLRVLVIQPNIKQNEKWLPTKREAITRHIFTQIEQGFAAHPQAQLALLPETAMPTLIDESDIFTRRLAAALPINKFLILGAVRREKKSEKEKEKAEYKYYNSVMIYQNKSGRVERLAYFDKYHLVPFGEYLPAQEFLEAIGLRQLTQLRGGFAARASAALNPTNFAKINLPAFTPLICFEGVFPYLASANNNNSKWLASLTNDAWFGSSLGPAQHLAHTRMRAIEQGQPLVRAANTGISAAFDGRGRRLASLPLNTHGFFAVDLPLSSQTSLYARTGNLIYFLTIIAHILTILGLAYRTRENILPAA